MYGKSYWNQTGRYTKLADALEELIPSSGEVPDAKKNPALEKFRKASNVYYDLFNNGLCNRARGFSKIFGFTLNQYGYRKGCYWELNRLAYEMIEEKMDIIILNAAAEQGINFEPIEVFDRMAKDLVVESTQMELELV